MAKTPADPASAWAMAVLYANIVLYSVCFMMTQPVLPYLTKQLGMEGSPRRVARVGRGIMHDSDQDG